MKQANERLAALFEDFAVSLRQINRDDQQDKVAGDGEDYDNDANGGIYDDEDDNDNVVQLGQAPVRDDTDDEKVITMKSGELRKVINSYRTLTRYAREGRIPDQDTRFKLHQAVRAVKHLIRRPRR